MTGRRLAAIIVILAATASPVLAETYKWVDAKGVVNYSNAPPPTVAAKTQLVEERISVVAPDPSLGPAIAAMQARAARRDQYEEADFLRRQNYMMASQASYPGAYCVGGSDCSVGYGASAYYPYTYPGGYFVAGSARRFPPTVMHHRPASPSGGRSAAHAGRGPSR